MSDNEKDGAICGNDPKESVNSASNLSSNLRNKEFSVGGSIITGKEKCRTVYRKNSCNEVDNSFGANLNQQNHLQTFYTSDSVDDGNMDVETLEDTVNERATESVNFANNEHSVEICDGSTSSLSLKESVGSSFSLDNKCVSADNNVTPHNSIKSSNHSKSLKSIKPQISGCRSSIQDIHDSCLRMDALPNVSPDSGIISVEGSPFGNESPHSAGGGGENSQEMNPLLPASSSVDRSNKVVDDFEAPKVNRSLENNVSKDRVDVINKEPHLSHSNVLDNGELPGNETNELDSKQVEVESNDLNITDNACSNDQPCDKSDERETHLDGGKKTKTLDYALPSHSDVKSNKDLEFEVDHERKILCSNLDFQQKSKMFFREEYTLETNFEMAEKILDSREKVQGSEKSVLCESAVKVDPVIKKKGAGRPRGSLNKKFDYDPPRRTYRKYVSKLKEHEHLESFFKQAKCNPDHDSDVKSTPCPVVKTHPHPVVKSQTCPNGEQIKRPRGRPRKLISGEESKTVTAKKKKKVRKRIFTRLKKSGVNKAALQSSSYISSKGNDFNDNLFESVHDESSKNLKLSLPPSSPKLFSESNIHLSGSKDFKSEESKESSHTVQNVTFDNTIEKSDFNGKDLEAILRSVKSSINSQFTTEKDEEMESSLYFDNPFKFVKSPSFPQLAHSTELNPVRTKPKYKKPKLHVMMRKTKRKKKKKFESSRIGGGSGGSGGGFGTSSPLKRLPFFTSRIQPSKILATSRLNVFHTGTGVEVNRPGTPTDGEQTEGSEKRVKKRRKLLSFKSKHKNITDPALAADLSVLEEGVKNMAISENAADNFIRVRPGEMPLPSIFRVKKIDVMKKVKDKMTFELSSFETCKPMKSTKKETTPLTVISPSIKNISKTLRKKISPEETSIVKDQTSLSDSSDQWLPPKKRHRMVHIESITSPEIPTDSETSELVMKDAYDGKRKGRRQRKAEGDGSVTNSNTHWSVDQVLTIDTNCYSTAGSSISTLTPSPCPSRQSTRSSTFASISSLSPVESTCIHGRLNSKAGSSIACPNHSLSAPLQNDFTSCVDCQLLRRSSSRTSNIVQSSTSSSTQSSSHQSLGFNSSSLYDRMSSLESTPIPKNSAVPAEQSRRYAHKRRKSSNCTGNESELSPPLLEKHMLSSSSSSVFSPDSSSYSAPPDIVPTKLNTNVSQHERQALKKFTNSLRSSTLQNSANRSANGGLSHSRALAQASCLSTVSDTETETPLCNTPTVNLSHLSSISTSVIPALSDSDRQPLPLEYCKKKQVVEEIQIALHYDSSDNSPSDHEEEKEERQYPSSVNPKAVPGQPPRKRYQRVGLFSDFYKDDEPRKRCENMVRNREKLVYVKKEHEYGLMPFPIHIGFHYMTQIQDFQLPYDIWWQDYHNQLPKKSDAKSKFRTIRSNVYVDGKANCRKPEIPFCSCKPSMNGGMGCQDDCLNRMIYTECSPLNCPLAERCGNQRIQKHEWAPGIEKFLTDDRGIGVRVTKPVKAGQFILEYLGEVISEVELRRRMMEEYSEECHHYALHLDSGNVIDGYRMGNIGRYVNHSCSPSCEMQKWNVNGLYRMVLVALRDIEAYEELGYDYNFDAFNQETQQECRCGSSECRGLIGGKGQRNSGVNKQEKTSDDPKDKRKSKLLNRKTRDGNYMVEHVPVLPPPMTYKERCFARKHSMFLVRNVDKVMNQRHPGQMFSPVTKEELHVAKVNCVTSDVLLSNLTESSVKTRLASFAKDNPEILRLHQLAQLFDKVLTELLSLKDEEGNSMITPLMSLPSRKKQPQYYQIVKEPIDLSMIKQRVKTGYYGHLKPFSADLVRLFKNVELYCGPRSDIGQVIVKLRHILICAMQERSAQIDELLGPGTTKMCMDMEERGAKEKQEPEEDIIRCICGVTRDEGLMLQCEKCMRWQHCDCVGASGKEEHYLCDRCEPRYYDPEILLAPPLPDTLHDCTHYMTLLKDDVQFAIGDCVYVMRDCKRSASGTPIRSSHRLIATSNPDSLDIFRIEQLWKDPKGERFASGTPYLRPQETFHEPTRKFLHNELFRTPNYEIIPLDLVMGKCVVMDPTAYCKGRPKGIKEQDVYVCEYRVDKTAHLFHKIKEIWYPLNTNRFCFDYFETKLSLKRTFTPHEIPEDYRRKAIRNNNTSSGKGKEMKEEKHDTKSSQKTHPVINSKVKIDESLKHDIKLKAEVKVDMNKGSNLNQEVKSEVCTEKSSGRKLIEEKQQEKRQRLDRLCIKLLNSLPGKQKVDLSYLLDGGKRIRKKSMK